MKRKIKQVRFEPFVVTEQDLKMYWVQLSSDEQEEILKELNKRRKKKK